MSVSSSLSNAISGLTAAARAAEVVSSNVSNALTEGYGRRELTLSSAALGGEGAGVRVGGITRVVDQLVINDRRLADAQLANSSVTTRFLSGFEDALGQPGSSGSLSSTVANLEASLIEATSRPDSEPRLQNVMNSAQALSSQLNFLSDHVQTERVRADSSIANQVETLNSTLQQIADLNYTIQRYTVAGRESAAFQDQRQQLIDGISDIVPLRQVARDDGQVALFTTGGTILLDGRAAEFSFTQTATITPEMTLASGALSGLSLNGHPIKTASVSGGSLAAEFAVRDEVAVNAQSNLDAVARDLIERFQDPAVDPSLGAADPGLFTDSGNALNAATETGLAGRISLNALADPAQGGDLWRLRDGLGAVAPGDVGNSTLLQALSDTLTASRTPASGDFSLVARSSSGLVADFLSMVSTERQTGEAEVTFASAKLETLTSQELQGGVDTDHELQTLLLVEQAFGANARVIKTADEMIQTILGL